MSKHKRHFKRRIQGKLVNGIRLSPPEEAAPTRFETRQPDSVAVLTCPLCGAKRYVNQAWFDFGERAKQVAIEGVPDEYKEAAAKLEILTRHKPCNAIMQVQMLTDEEEKEKPTTERLVLALEQAGAPEEMIRRARAGYYDEWKHDLALPLIRSAIDAKTNVHLPDESFGALPLIQLMIDAKAAGLGESFYQRIIDGEFDGTKEESDAWARSAEGQATFRELLRGKDKPS